MDWTLDIQPAHKEINYHDGHSYVEVYQTTDGLYAIFTYGPDGSPSSGVYLTEVAFQAFVTALMTMKEHDMVGASQDRHEGTP